MVDARVGIKPPPSIFINHINISTSYHINIFQNNWIKLKTVTLWLGMLFTTQSSLERLAWSSNPTSWEEDSSALITSLLISDSRLKSPLHSESISNLLYSVWLPIFQKISSLIIKFIYLLQKVKSKSIAVFYFDCILMNFISGLK